MIVKRKIRRSRIEENDKCLFFFWVGFFVCLMLYQEINAQNLIPNPDFDHVFIYYQQGRKVQPRNWQSLNEEFPLFTHQALRNGEAFRQAPGANQSGYGVFFMHIGRINDGVFVSLVDSLKKGQRYSIRLRVRPHNIPDLSVSSDVIIGEKGEETWMSRLVANQRLMSFMIRLHEQVPGCLQLCNDSILIIDFPEGLNADHPHWVEIGTEYIATGKEKYISIGLCINDDYFDIIRKYKADTLSKANWHTRYLLSGVTMESIVLPVEKPLLFIHSLGGEPKKTNNAVLQGKFILQKITFGFDCFALNEESRDELRSLADWLIKNPLYHLTITGHADATGMPDYNQVLSENRAREVYNFLVENGVAQKRLAWKGKGDTEPLGEYYMSKNNSSHRRVEFNLHKAGNE